MNRANLIAVVVLNVSLATICSAHVGTQEFTDPAALAAATTNRATIGFRAILPATLPFQSFNPLDVCRTSFSTSTPSTFVNVTRSDYYSPNSYPEDFIVNSFNPSPHNRLVISLPRPAYAVALEYGGLGFNGTGLGRITLSNGYAFNTVLPTVGHTRFVGFLGNEGITSVTFDTTNDSWVLTKFVLADKIGHHMTNQQGKSKNEIHFMYVLPCDGINAHLDTNDTIANSVEAFQKWFEGQSGGQRLITDRRRNDLDITFLRLSRTDRDLESYGIFLRDQLEAEIHAAGFNDPDKIYAVYYGGHSTAACGGAPWPPALVGNVAALYLLGEPPNAPPCATNRFANLGDPPGYWEFAMIHEIFHALGFVATCAPHHTLQGHVSDDPRDLMYAGPLPWQPSILDVGRDDYFGHDNAACPDLQDSSFLTPSSKHRRR